MEKSKIFLQFLHASPSFSRGEEAEHADKNVGLKLKLNPNFKKINIKKVTLTSAKVSVYVNPKQKGNGKIAPSQNIR